MSDNTLNLTPSLYEYLLKTSLREPPVLQELRMQTAKMSMGHMQISPEQGQFMRLLIELMGARNTLEVGTFTGYSTLSVALALPADGRIITCDINKDWTGIAQRFWQKAGVAAKIDLRVGPAATTLQNLIADDHQESFDFAFIDADKINYPAYYELCLALIRKGGLIAIDNTLWGGDVADENNQDERTQMFRKLNAQLLKDERITLSMLPLGDGLTLARKR